MSMWLARKHLIRNAFALVICTVFCLGGLGSSCNNGTLWRAHDDAFTSQGLLKAEADDLHATVVSAHTEIPIPPDRNVLWCGTFQLAWNEACKLAGGHLRFRPPVPAAVDILNRPAFAAADLDEASYVALAGYVRDGITARVSKALRDKFDGRASPVLLPDNSDKRPQDIVAYAYLFKNLEFPVPYERGAAPAAFAGRAVECFGMGADYKPGREQMAAQTLIHDYVNQDDFVIEIKTKSPGDRLLLAKVAPEDTLAQTVAMVQRRADVPPTPAAPADVLIVPKANFDITRNYRELCGMTLVPTTPAMADDLTLLAALQNTRFQMDEKGVRLRSEVSMHFGCSAEYRPPPVHVLIFDKPFLLLLSRDGAKHPYLALWIANAELLVEAK